MSYVSSHQRRINRAVTQSNTRRLIDWLGGIAFASVFGLFFHHHQLALWLWRTFPN